LKHALLTHLPDALLHRFSMKKRTPFTMFLGNASDCALTQDKTFFSSTHSHSIDLAECRHVA
jgi:hypothetical protein